MATFPSTHSNRAASSRIPSSGPSIAAAGPELSIVVPTFNESNNVAELVKRLDTALRGVRWEVVFVDDDSTDGTAAVVNKLGAVDARVRCIQRVGRRGLASACIEGMLSSPAPYLAVMDGDLQHDETALLPMLQRLRSEAPLDLAIGSRYVSGGSVGNWDRDRSRVSDIATSLAHFICKQPIADPMSGFFMIRRTVFLDTVHRLSAIGFKILLDLFASSPRPLNFYEQPYTFRERREGESKFDNRAIGEYLYLLLDKSVGRFIPARFIVFSLVGATGVSVHMAVLTLLFKLGEVSFLISQIAATLSAMTFNYWLNNLTTYRDRRRRGWKWVTGWLGFSAACGLGAAANAGVASFIFESDHSRWALSALAGIAVSAVWNYAVTSVYTWNDRTRK